MVNKRYIIDSTYGTVANTGTLPEWMDDVEERLARLEKNAKKKRA